MDWLDLLAVQGTLKSLLQHHSSKASILQHTAFFMVQLSHLYMTPGKTIPLTIQTFVGKVTSLLFNRLSRFVLAFLPRSKCLLISWLQSPSAVILKPKKRKSVTVSSFPIYLHEVMGLDAMIFTFWMLSFKPPFPLSTFTFINRLFDSFWPGEENIHFHFFFFFFFFFFKLYNKSSYTLQKLIHGPDTVSIMLVSYFFKVLVHVKRFFVFVVFTPSDTCRQSISRNLFTFTYLVPLIFPYKLVIFISVGKVFEYELLV